MDLISDWESKNYELLLVSNGKAVSETSRIGVRGFGITHLLWNLAVICIGTIGCL